MPQKKRKSSKKRRKTSKKGRLIDELMPETCIPNQYDDNISLYEKENVDLLETINGIEWDRNQFQQDFPHLSEELQDANLNYPMDAVRWEDEECEEDEISPSIRPEEPTLSSLLLRSKSEEEAIEIIHYLKKQGEISPGDAKKIISQIESKGLKAVQRKLGKNIA